MWTFWGATHTPNPKPQSVFYITICFISILCICLGRETHTKLYIIYIIRLLQIAIPCGFLGLFNPYALSEIIFIRPGTQPQIATPTYQPFNTFHPIPPPAQPQPNGHQHQTIAHHITNFRFATPPTLLWRTKTPQHPYFSPKTAEIRHFFDFLRIFTPKITLSIPKTIHNPTHTARIAHPTPQKTGAFHPCFLS